MLYFGSISLYRVVYKYLRVVSNIKAIFWNCHKRTCSAPNSFTDLRGATGISGCGTDRVRTGESMARRSYRWLNVWYSSIRGRRFAGAVRACAVQTNRGAMVDRSAPLGPERKQSAIELIKWSYTCLPWRGQGAWVQRTRTTLA